MGMQAYETAVQLMAQYPEEQEFVGPRPVQLVEEAEQALDLAFPPIYRRFLLEYGAGNFGSEEIYGLIDRGWHNSSVPDGIWFTLSERKEHGLPDHLVAIYHTGFEELFCVEADSAGKTVGRVVAVPSGAASSGQPYEVIAEDFGAFFLDRVRAAIELMEDDVE